VALLADGKTALAVGGAGTILRSGDGGQSWTAATSRTTPDLGSVALLAHGKTALAVGGAGTILRSGDGGQSWTAATSGTQANLASAVLGADGKTALAVGDAATILRSADGGQTRIAATSGTQANLTSVALLADGKTALAVGGAGTILRSGDGGQSWIAAASGTTAYPWSMALTADGKTALAVSVDGRIVRSGDRGQSWSAVASGTTAALLSIALAADGKTALAVGWDGTILRSGDGGQSWTATASGTTRTLSMALTADGKTALAVGVDGTILRSGDGGQSWTAVASGTKAALRSVALQADRKTALAVGDAGTILRSSDAGQTWEDPVRRPSRQPPRIAWLLWAGSFILVFPAFLALTPEKPPAKDIAHLLATDRPLRAGDLDASGKADQLAAQIGSFLRNANTAPPLTIAITGSWGSGKSSVLSRLRDDLIKGKQRPVWFNAWHRQGEESLFAALMQAVRREALPSWWSLDGIDVRMRFLFSRVRSSPIRWLLAVLAFAAWIGILLSARWPTLAEALAPLHKLRETDKLAEAGLRLLVVLARWPLTILLGGLLTFGALRDRLTSAGLDPGRLLAAAGRATRWRDLGVQLAFRDRFKEALTEVTTALGRRTLTILIDDLDRCRPDQITEVLEAINFLTDADGCFVVFGFDRPKVLAGIGLAYREAAAELAGAEDTTEVRKAYAEDFLRKLIQIEVPVPRFGAAAANRLIDAASEIGGEPRSARAWLPGVGGAGLCLRRRYRLAGR
jgi:photosystem II stability/assembly factor-like uncharacterized protein